MANLVHSRIKKRLHGQKCVSQSVFYEMTFVSLLKERQHSHNICMGNAMGDDIRDKYATSLLQRFGEREELKE